MIVIETGRNAVKVVGESIEPFSFASTLGEGRDLNLKEDDQNSLSHLDVHVNGHRYFVGDLAHESYDYREMLTSSKIHEETTVLFGTALFLANPTPKERIITLIPIDQHTPEEKQELSQWLSREYKVKRGSTVRSFKVDHVDVVPEGAAAAFEVVFDHEFKMKKRFVDEPVIRLVDIGSRTVNYVTFIERNGKKMHYLEKDSGTFSYGCSTMKGDLIKKIKADLSRVWDDMSVVTIFVGGGTIKLEKDILREFSNPIIADNPLYANALGALKLGRMKYGRDS